MATTTKKRAPKNGTKRGRKPQKRKLRANENPHPRRLNGKLALEFKAASLEVELRRSKLEAANAKLDTLSMDERYDPVFLQLRKREQSAEALRASVIAFAEVQKRVADKFEIPYEKLHEYTIDTESGVVTSSPIPT